MKPPIIALITDFGEDDFFVASLKAVILQIAPSARIIDITHWIPSFDIMRGGFVLFSCLKYFPHQTIFLAVIDPGVGSARKILLVRTKKYFFIAPDNGVLSLALESEEVEQIIDVTNEKFFLEKQSKTFEGRDKMAPVAAWLSRGIPCREFGSRLKTFKKLSNISPLQKGSRIVGSILHVDKFGNLITNIPAAMLTQFQEKPGTGIIALHVKNQKIASFRENYSVGKRGDLFFLVGSVGLVEIAANQESACRILDAQVSDRVELVREIAAIDRTTR